MSEPPAGGKRSAPAALRNREPIARVLREELPPLGPSTGLGTGLVLETASGTGEHVVHFAAAFPELEWQPSDLDRGALASIAAHRTQALARGAAGNLRPPIALDMRAAEWPGLGDAVAVLSINMVHISPTDAAAGLVRGAARLLPEGAPLILYGPYLEDGIATLPSNAAFDADLRSRDPRWGLRRVGWLDELAAGHGLARTRRVEMPANNLMLVYRRAG